MLLSLNLPNMQGSLLFSRGYLGLQNVFFFSSNMNPKFETQGC